MQEGDTLATATLALATHGIHKDSVKQKLIHSMNLFIIAENKMILKMHTSAGQIEKCNVNVNVNEFKDNQ